jgi:CNT family concentrative nucleoside transporter
MSRILRVVLLAMVIGLTILAFQISTTWGVRGQAACGVLAFLLVIAAFSANVRLIHWRTVIWGIILQVSLAWFILKFETPPFTIPLGITEIHSNGRPGFEMVKAAADVVTAFLNFTKSGAKFVFGPLADPAELSKVFPNNAFIFAFAALPTIIFVSAFFTVLYQLGILQFIVRIMARIMMYLMGTSGAESLSAAANVFMGQTEAPLIVKPYVPRMTQSELLALMVGGMATIAGGVMAVFIEMGADPVAIIATSVMAAPCGLYLSKIMLPETSQPETAGGAHIPSEKMHANVVDAAAAGASDGMHLALNVAAMLIAFLAFIAMFNHLLGLINTERVMSYSWWPGDWILPKTLSLEWIFGRMFAPVALLMGVEGKDITSVGSLLGTKLVANEFVAYVQMTSPEVRESLSPRSFILATYALTGFANVSSIGIQLGGIGAIAKERRGDLARLGARALLTGFTATLINASIAGLLLG